MSAYDPIDWYWRALQWRSTLKLAWGSRGPCPIRLSKWEEDEFGVRPLSLVALEPPEVWAETARLIELDARERGDQALVDLAVEIGQQISRFYEMAYNGQDVDRWRDKINEEFGFYHAYMRHGAYAGWTNRISDLGNDADWLVWIVEQHVDEIGMWRLLARLLANRALQLTRRWCCENTDDAIKLGIDEFDLAPHLLAIGLEDSYNRIIANSRRKAAIKGNE